MKVDRKKILSEIERYKSINQYIMEQDAATAEPDLGALAPEPGAEAPIPAAPAVTKKL
jgi:hypothetical protein